LRTVKRKEVNMKMGKSRRVAIAVLLSVLLVSTVVGVALAQTTTGDQSPVNSLMSRVAQILGIDQQKLQDAFTQAQKEMRDEALDNYLKDLVTQGTITQQQSDQYKTWWESQPDISVPGLDTGHAFGAPPGGTGGPGGMMGDRGHRGGPPPAPSSSPTPAASSSTQ
jgi:hypothetical protein